MLPTTAWGRSAIGLAAAFIVLFAVFFVLMLTGPRGGETFTFSPQLIPGILAVVCAVGALVTGLIGIVFRHERSFVAIAATGIGFLASGFVVGEFLIPPFD